MEGYIAEIRMFAADFAPRNWAYCAGQILSIAQNTALFSLLGTTFGGNGVQTFGLPDLRSRIAVGTGTASGINSFILGEMTGTESVTLNMTNLPAHNHTAVASVTQKAGIGKTVLESDPTGNFYGQPTTHQMYGSPSNTAMGAVPVSVQIGVTGGNQPVSILQPFLAMNYIICLYGIFPSRN